MSAYPLSWITEQLAVGHAPMSYEELDSIRRQGIDGIVNLCGEYCDLHDIEKGHGFEVHYLPVEDNEAPSLPELEKALQWLDEAEGVWHDWLIWTEETSATFSATVWFCTSMKCWWTMPMPASIASLGVASLTAAPLTRISPSSAA